MNGWMNVNQKEIRATIIYELPLPLHPPPITILNYFIILHLYNLTFAYSKMIQS